MVASGRGAYLRMPSTSSETSGGSENTAVDADFAEQLFATVGETTNSCNSCNNNQDFYCSHRRYGLMVLLATGLTLTAACAYSTLSHSWQRQPQSKLRGLGHSNEGDPLSETASEAQEDEHALKEASGFLGLVERSNGSAANVSSNKLEERSDESPPSPTVAPLGTMADSLARSNMPGAGASMVVAASPVAPPTPVRPTPQQPQQPLPGHGKAAAVASSDLPGVLPPKNASLAATTQTRAPAKARSQRGMPDRAAEPKDHGIFFL